MEDRNIYQDIAERTQGDIYIGVVGPVRTGKSTFIKRFMDTLVLPNITGDYQRERATDELPQSAAGRTIMTTEPKFIPEDAVEIALPDQAHFKVRMIDCVGYIVPSSLGYIEGDQPRMVKTPWYENEIPFNMAAEIGTRKVISEHSTIGLVITTDGSISDIPRAEYEEAEERVVKELKELNKPFIVLLNCMYPQPHAVAPALLHDLRLLQRQFIERRHHDTIAGGLHLIERVFHAVIGLFHLRELHHAVHQALFAVDLQPRRFCKDFIKQLLIHQHVHARATLGQVHVGNLRGFDIFAFGQL